MTDATPFTLAEALAFVEDQCTILGDSDSGWVRQRGERYARLAATLRQLAEPTHRYLTHSVGTGEEVPPLPEEIGTLIDNLEWDCVMHNIPARDRDRAALDSAIRALLPRREPSEEMLDRMRREMAVNPANNNPTLLRCACRDCMRAAYAAQFGEGAT